MWQRPDRSLALPYFESRWNEPNEIVKGRNVQNDTHAARQEHWAPKKDSDDTATGGLPVRSRPASGVLLIEGQPTIIYDTVCTKNRSRWLANHAAHEELRDVWTEADAWLMGRYMIMPDHIHYFAAYTGSAIEYENWLRYWKSQFTKRHRIAAHRWQSNDWDTRMRTWQQYDDKWEYVRWNPVRHRLVKQPGQWPHQGTVYEFRWE